MSAAEIERDLVEVLSVLHPARAELTALRAAGVTAARVVALYPPAYVDLTRSLREVLINRNQLAHFLHPLVRGGMMQRLEVLEDRIHEPLYTTMTEEVYLPTREGPDADTLLVLMDAALRNSLWQLKPGELLSGALLNTASILWLATNWRQVSGFESASTLAEIAELIAILRAALPAQGEGHPLTFGRGPC